MFEINLVPDVKAEMINTQKKRNVVLFASAAVSAIAAAIVVILFVVKIGQDITVNGQDTRLKAMSDTIERYEGLDNLLTVQKQLSDLQTISNNKKLLSRVFTVLHSIVQQENGDEIKISSLDVNMDTAQLTFDGQANAGPNTDGIDYRVLESFTKSIKLMKYDYGRYVNSEGNEIPSMCIFESNSNGIPYTDEKGSIRAKWAKGAEGCDPVQADDDGYEGSGNTATKKQIQDINTSGEPDGTDLVWIYRTPQFTDWYRKGFMKTDGVIEEVPHFKSECITYSGEETDSTVNWSSNVSNECMMAPDGIEITNSTNGKQTGGSLVLMFSAVLHLNPDIFSFKNKHVITILPSGHQNVTDSFMQVGDMFAEQAKVIDTEE
ncbi:hypothetical protein IKG06_03550 [Candidatus Saccharibacteria bacterium]|nr:hypothetical protein [Candidatus Saccharibacteria bacterium]